MLLQAAVSSSGDASRLLPIAEVSSRTNFDSVAVQKSFKKRRLDSQHHTYSDRSSQLGLAECPPIHDIIKVIQTVPAMGPQQEHSAPSTPCLSEYSSPNPRRFPATHPSSVGVPMDADHPQALEDQLRLLLQQHQPQQHHQSTSPAAKAPIASFMHQQQQHQSTSPAPEAPTAHSMQAADSRHQEKRQKMSEQAPMQAAPQRSNLSLSAAIIHSTMSRPVPGNAAMQTAQRAERSAGGQLRHASPQPAIPADQVIPNQASTPAKTSHERSPAPDACAQQKQTPSHQHRAEHASASAHAEQESSPSHLVPLQNQQHQPQQQKSRFVAVHGNYHRYYGTRKVADFNADPRLKVAFPHMQITVHLLFYD